MRFTRPVSISLALVLAGWAAPGTLAQEFPEGRWIDLTHTFSSEAIYWPTADGFEHESVFEGRTEGGYYYSSFNYSASEHGGTHLDAPIHFAEGHEAVDQLAVDQLIGPAAVIDVSKTSIADRDYQVAVSDFEAWESEHGPLPVGCIVLLNTGSSQWWPDREKYMGTARRGEAAVADLHFPGLDPKAARWLVENRSIKAIGLDTPSIDYGQSTLFESHRILFEHDIPALENVANLDTLPAWGAFLIALPMKIENGSGGPARIVALLPE